MGLPVSKYLTGLLAVVLLPGLSSAATTTFDITGNLSKEYGSCTQITFSFSGSDCSWGRNRPAANATWIGPLFGGANYAIDGVKDQVTYIPTVADNVPQGTASSAANFIPAVDDGKFPAGITGQIVIDDKGTPGNLADDTVSGTMTIAAMARNVPTGQFTRAVQRWTSMDHVIPEIAVNAAETVANGNGGVDYVIGSRGFPTARCYRFDTNNCFPTSDMMPDFADARFWVQPPVGSKGIERSGLLGQPGFDEVNPPSPTPPTGNVGAVSIGTINGGSCVTNNQAVDDCAASTLIWGAAEDPGFDNMVMKISTNGSGQITSAQVYWTQEFAISFGGPPAGFDNSFVAGTITFTGQVIEPRARDFAVEVFQGSAGNVLDTLSNSVNFGGPVTVSIVSGPTPLGSATVLSNQIVYDSIAGSGTDTIIYQATDGTVTDQGTITITITPVDIAADPFTFTDVTGVPLATPITSNAVVVTGINTAIPISVSGAETSEYSINGGAFTKLPGVVINGDSIRVRHTSSLFPDTAENSLAQMGATSDTFTSATLRYAIDDTASTPMGTPVDIYVLQNDLAFPAPVYAGIWVNPLYGTASVSGSPGSQSGIRITYTPNPGYSGPDSLEYWAEGGAVVDYGVVSLTVINNDGDADGVGNNLDNCPSTANPGQQDGDSDGVGNACDNCTERANANQRDTNGDGYGNICDTDLNNSGLVTAADYAILRNRINTANADADFNGNGIVTALDFAIFRSYINLPPGPSGLHP